MLLGYYVAVENKGLQPTTTINEVISYVSTNNKVYYV